MHGDVTSTVGTGVTS